MLFFLISVACAIKCTYDEHRSDTNYMLQENYHERYCDHTCPCDGDEECEMDFTGVGFRELENVTGAVNRLITKDYDLTFALNVPEGTSYSVKTVQIRSNRMHYKLRNNTILSVGNQIVDPEFEHAQLTTIVRCYGNCIVKDSFFPKGPEEQISFISNLNEDGDFYASQFTFENVKFNAYSNSSHFARNFVRENAKIQMKDVTFVLNEPLEQVNVIPLFFAPSKDQITFETIKIEGAAASEFAVVKQCDDKWIVAQRVGKEDVIDCVDPTASKGNESLETGCTIAFIIIFCAADITLVILIAVFLVLIFLPILKKKFGKGKYEKM